MESSPPSKAAPPSRALPWIITSNFAEGFPYSIVHQVSSQLFLAMGSSASTVGLTAAYGWVWNLKFLSAPLVERFLLPRHWAVIFELCLALSILAVSAAVGVSLGVVAGLFLVVGVFAASHDVAVDAHYIDALEPKDQSAFSGVRVAAFRVAMVAAGGGLVMIAGAFGIALGFRFALACGAVVMLILAAFHFRALFAHPVRRQGSLRKREGGVSELATLRTFLNKPAPVATIAFLVLYRAGDALMFAMNAPFLQSLGFDLSMRGLVQNTLGGVCSVAGAMLGGFITARRGLARTLFPIATLQSVSILLYVLVAATRPATPVVIAVVLTEQLAAGIGTAGLTVFILRVARGPHRATHYALATALMSIATTVLGLGSGFLLEATGFPLFFSIAFAASVPGVALAARVRSAHPEDGSA